MLSLLVIVAVVVAAVGASAQRNQDCIHQLTRPNCLGVTNCCWHTGGLHMATTHQATCVSCITLKASHKTALQSLWQKWEYNRDGGLPDANVDNILCPNLGTVANHRVSCNDDGELTDLTLGNDGLYGEMAHLCELSPGPGGPQDTIETLTLSGNFLWGPLPACANTFTRVKQFWIDHNFLRGQLPNIRDLANINTLAVSNGKSDCRLVSFKYLTAEFGPDNNCFSCMGGFEDLPPACAPTDQWPNACNIYQNEKDVTCPSDNGMPERPSTPTAPPSCGTATGTEGCPCNADGSCNQGSGFAVECTAANLCVKGSSLPLRCQADPASIGCPCNAQTGKCKDDTLVCKEPEVICVQSASRASLSLALVATFALLAVLFA